MTPLKFSVKLNPDGIICLSDSGIIVSCYGTRCLWTIDPRTRTTERFAGALWDATNNFEPTQQIEWEDPFSIKFHCPDGVAYHESDGSIFVVDQFACTVLPDHLFVMSTL
jgi:hypothetical protein